MDSPFTTASSSSTSFYDYNAQDDYHLDTDYVFWQASQSRCDALNNLMLEAAQPKTPNMSAISSLSFTSTSSFISIPSSTPFQGTIQTRDSRARPTRTRPLSSTTGQQNATPSTSTFELPGSAGDTDTLISLIKLVSQKVDENSESKRRYLEHSRMRARQKQKERKELRRKVKQNEYPLNGKVARLDTDPELQQKNILKEATTAGINIHHESYTHSEPPLRIERNSLDVDMDMPPPHNFVTITNARRYQEQPEAIASLGAESYRKEVPDKSVPTKLHVEHSLKRDTSLTSNSFERGSHLSASQDSNQAQYKPVLSEKAKVDEDPTSRALNDSAQSDTTSERSTSTSFSSTQHSNSKLSANMSVPSGSQSSSQRNSTKFKSKLPVLGMRRICNATTLPTNSSIYNSSYVAEQPPSQKPRPFKTPFANPLESSQSAIKKEDSVLAGFQKEREEVYRHQSEPKSGLHSLSQDAKFTGPPVISEEKQDTSFNSSDFDMDIDAEELERVCSAYD